MRGAAYPSTTRCYRGKMSAGQSAVGLGWAGWCPETGHRRGRSTTGSRPIVGDVNHLLRAAGSTVAAGYAVHAVIRISTERLPLVLLDFDGQLQLEDIDLFITRFSGWVAEQRRVGLGIRSMDIAMPEARVIKTFAQWIREQEQILAHHIIGIGVAVRSPVLRGALAFMNRLAPPPCPQRIFATWDEAERWLVDQLTERDVSAAR